MDKAVKKTAKQKPEKAVKEKAPKEVKASSPKRDTKTLSTTL